MQKLTTLFLQAAIVVIGAVALALLLWEPHLEGRNANATNFEIYFNDPFLAYAYLASLVFFFALYQAFRLVGFVGNDRAFSLAALRAIRIVRNCALILIAFIIGGVAQIAIFNRGAEDIAGGVFIGLALIFIFATLAAFATVSEIVLRSGAKKIAGD